MKTDRVEKWIGDHMLLMCIPVAILAFICIAGEAIRDYFKYKKWNHEHRKRFTKTSIFRD